MNGGKTTVYADVQGASSASSSSGGGGAVGDSLCAALVYHDKRVRYEAAIALANLNPNSDFANKDKVLDNLIDALGESGQRVVLVVERDLDLRNRIVGLLRESGYMVFSTSPGLDGLNRAKSFPGEDLIIVSSELNKDGAGGDPIEIQFIDELKQDYRTKTIPCMVLTPGARQAEMQKLVDEKNAADVITPEVDRAAPCIVAVEDLLDLGVERRASTSGVITSAAFFSSTSFCISAWRAPGVRTMHGSSSCG